MPQIGRFIVGIYVDVVDWDVLVISWKIKKKLIRSKLCLIFFQQKCKCVSKAENIPYCLWYFKHFLLFLLSIFIFSAYGTIRLHIVQHVNKYFVSKNNYFLFLIFLIQDTKLLFKLICNHPDLLVILVKAFFTFHLIIVFLVYFIKLLCSSFNFRCCHLLRNSQTQLRDISVNKTINLVDITEISQCFAEEICNTRRRFF